MKLPEPEKILVPEGSQVYRVKNYLIRLVRALEYELKTIRGTTQSGGPSMEQIIESALTSERVLDAVYNYCKKRWEREIAQAAQEANTNEVS